MKHLLLLLLLLCGLALEEPSSESIQETIVSTQVSVAPFFASLISDVRVAQGHPALFEVVVHGTPQPTIAWFKEENLISPSPEYQVIFFFICLYLCLYDTAHRVPQRAIPR